MKTGQLLTSDGRMVCASCRLATTPFSRLRGLLGYSRLEPGEGMYFRPARSIHTFFMRFPIDVVFCDSQLVVLGIAPALKPWRTAGRKGTKVIVELSAGGAAQLAPGDQLALSPPQRP